MGQDTMFNTLWPLVGRDAELRDLDEALDDRTWGGAAFLGGPGFGKTRLATRSLEMARERDMVVTSLRATRSAAGIPFAALSPLFEQLGVSPQVGPELLRAVTEAVDRVRGSRRMAIVVDDAQELDDPSAALLAQLLARAGTFVVFTVRTGERGADEAGGLWTDDRIRRIPVGGLPEADLRALAAAVVGGPLDGSTLREIVVASDGNPLFLRELLQGALETGALTCELGLWRLRGALSHSPRLRDLIEQRLAGLTRVEREALELVAIGDPVALAVLDRLVTLETLETLEDRGLLDVVRGGNGLELRLNHPLHGEVVRAHLPVLRRARLCRWLADAAEAAGGAQGADALRVAVWRLDGGGIGSLAATLDAARAAQASNDPELAVRLGRAAWERWRSVDAALVVGDALDVLGRCRDADRVLDDAAPLTRTDRQRTSLAVRRAAALFRSLGDAEGADRVLRQASATVTDRGCLRELDASRGNHLLLTGDVAGAVALALPLLVDPGDAAFAQASLDVGTGLALAGRSREAIEHTDEGLAARVDLDDPQQLSAIGIYLVAQALAHLHAGHLDRAAAIGEGGYQVAIDKGNADGQAWFASISGLVLLAQGRLASAANMFREVATLFGALNHPGRRWGLGGIALATAQLGRSSDGTEALVELDAMAPTAVHLQDIGIMRGRAWTALVRGDGTGARRLLREAASRAEGWGQHAAAVEALHDLVRMGADPVATEALERLGDRVDGALMPARLAYARAAVGHTVRLAAESADRFEELGACLFAAEAATLESTLAAEEGLARRARVAAVRADRLIDSCEGARTPALDRGRPIVQLTRREHEVALLAAQDLTSRAIAERLFVSARTVDNHLQRIYTKLGIRGRSELPTRL